VGAKPCGSRAEWVGTIKDIMQTTLDQSIGAYPVPVTSMADLLKTSAPVAQPVAVVPVAHNPLRPQRLDGYIGQDRMRENLSIAIESARAREVALDHVLLTGPPGLGKTTLAYIIANELDAKVYATSAPAIETAADLNHLLVKLQPGDVLFIDEIHRLSPSIEEILYPAMEDFQIDLVVGKGSYAKSVKFAIAPFTLIGATTRAGLISAPLRTRFSLRYRLDPYPVADLTEIVTRSADVLDVQLDPTAAEEIAKRSRGTPRVANGLLARVRDFASVRAPGPITRDVAAAALALLEIDAHGLDEVDRRLLTAMIEMFGGGPVGLGTLATAIGEDEGTVEDVHEPYLIQSGFLARTPRGRVATALAHEYMQQG
jgi:holliday junction DNA helicase RuvB